MNRLEHMQIGIIGLGRMGSRIAAKLASSGHKVSVWNRSLEDAEELKKTSKVLPKYSIESLVKDLIPPRIVWIMVHHAAVEEVLTEVRKFAVKGDIVIDGGNSSYKDTERRFTEFEKAGIKYLGIGVSGGVIAAKNGYPMMIGGSRSGYDTIKPVLDSLSKPNGGHEYFGTGGAGHFVKMVHNGIEYGMMQSLSEGLEVLEKSKYKFDLLSVAKLWQKGTIVSGFILDRAKDALEEGDVDECIGIIESTGEAQWTVDTAKEQGVPVEIIERSLEYRKRSKQEAKIQNSYTAKMIAALRREFGGHEVKKKN